MMKKNFLFLSVIVLLVTILYVVGCCTKDKDKATDNLKEVTIYLKSVEINGVKHLLMFDSNNYSNIDSLITEVKVGYRVKWKRDKNSGIRKIDRIYPKTDNPQIFEKEPTQSYDSFILDVPVGVKPGTKEGYLISFTLNDSTKVTIDPYLRIPE